MAKKQKNLDDITKKFGDERQKALDNALKNIEKDFGKGAIMRLGTKGSSHEFRIFGLGYRPWCRWLS